MKNLRSLEEIRACFLGALFGVCGFGAFSKINEACKSWVKKGKKRIVNVKKGGTVFKEFILIYCDGCTITPCEIFQIFQEGASLKLNKMPDFKVLNNKIFIYSYILKSICIRL